MAHSAGLFPLAMPYPSGGWFMSHNNDWHHAAHATHVVKHLLETETGHAATKVAFSTAVAVATAVPVLIPLVAVSGLAFWWLKK
jgi:hypothetical protein